MGNSFAVEAEYQELLSVFGFLQKVWAAPAPCPCLAALGQAVCPYGILCCSVWQLLLWSTDGSGSRAPVPERNLMLETLGGSLASLKMSIHCERQTDEQFRVF